MLTGRAFAYEDVRSPSEEISICKALGSVPTTSKIENKTKYGQRSR